MTSQEKYTQLKLRHQFLQNEATIEKDSTAFSLLLKLPNHALRYAALLMVLEQTLEVATVMTESKYGKPILPRIRVPVVPTVSDDSTIQTAVQSVGAIPGAILSALLTWTPLDECHYGNTARTLITPIAPTRFSDAIPSAVHINGDKRPVAIPKSPVVHCDGEGPRPLHIGNVTDAQFVVAGWWLALYTTATSRVFSSGTTLMGVPDLLNDKQSGLNILERIVYASTTFPVSIPASKVPVSAGRGVTMTITPPTDSPTAGKFAPIGEIPVLDSSDQFVSPSVGTTPATAACGQPNSTDIDEINFDFFVGNDNLTVETDWATASDDCGLDTLGSGSGHGHDTGTPGLAGFTPFSTQNLGQQTPGSDGNDNSDNAASVLDTDIHPLPLGEVRRALFPANNTTITTTSTVTTCTGAITTASVGISSIIPVGIQHVPSPRENITRPESEIHTPTSTAQSPKRRKLKPASDDTSEPVFKNYRLPSCYCKGADGEVPSGEVSVAVTL